MLSPSAHIMALWRTSLWVTSLAENAGRLAHNVVVAHLTGAPRKPYQEARLPLNTEELINLLFRYGEARGMRERQSVVLSFRMCFGCDCLPHEGDAALF